MNTKSNLHRRFTVALLMLSVMIGISAVGVPGTNDAGQNKNSIDVGVPVNTFKAVLVDNKNNKWFLTEAGVISFNGEKWTLYPKISNLDSPDIRGWAMESSSPAQEIWMATPGGAIVASLPVNTQTKATNYNTQNSAIISDNVVAVSAGSSPLRWFGTDKGISALKKDKWLTPDYEDQYPEDIFQLFPILSMGTDEDGDTLYVGTKGAGVARFFSNDVDGITGASVYAQWGPILLPSDTIYSIFIDLNDVKWFGTNMGIARHIGQNTTENWSVFTTEEGLVNNFVQAIAPGNNGKTWFGTKGGISVFDGEHWKSYTREDGLVSNNILCITVDQTGVVWIGTDNGVSSFNNNKFTSY
jgi:ligand-binding sensor domain-containing protein